MTTDRDTRADALLAEALRGGREPAPELGPARLELERRRLLARIADEAARDRGRAYRPRRRAWVLAAAAAAAAIAVAGAVVLYGRGEGPAVSLTGEWRLERGDAIAAGALVSVPAGARAVLALADGTRIWVDGGSRLSVADEGAFTVRLRAGRIVAHVAKRPGPDRAFVVATGFGEVEVLGTVFSVVVDDGGMAVRLYGGRVRLATAAGAVSLSPGQGARATAGGIAALGPFAPRETGPDRALVGDELALDGAAAPVAPAAAAAPAAEPEQAAAQPVAKATTASPPPAADHPADPEARVLALWRAGRYAEIVALTDAAGTPPGQLFYRGKALAALGRWREAAGAYAAAAEGGAGGEAVYLAAVAYHRADDLAASLAFADRAAALGGPNADHAHRLGFVSLIGLGRYADGARSASGYLAAFPAGAHVDEARFALGTGLRLSRRWAEAADAYAAFAAAGRGEPQMRDDAAFYVGYCRLMAGSADEGRRRLEQYLSSYPTGRHVEQARAALTAN